MTQLATSPYWKENKEWQGEEAGRDKRKEKCGGGAT
jgi:hypothetical protein